MKITSERDADMSFIISFLDDFNRATVLDYIIDILTFCVEHHSYHIKNYVISKDMLRRVLALMQSKHKFLALGMIGRGKQHSNTRNQTVAGGYGWGAGRICSGS